MAEIMGVGFDHLMGRVPTTLSGGEQQRVAIGRCIVRDPSLFLMDEPICNLDAKLRESTRLELKKLLRSFAITSLYVTHDQQEAVFMGDRIAVMREGRIEQIGTSTSSTTRPPISTSLSSSGSPPIGVIPATIEDRRVSIGDGRVGRCRMTSGRRADSRSGADRRAARELASGRGGRRVLPVRHIERIPTERSSFLFTNLGGENIVIAAPLDYPEREQIQVSPDWERVYFFAADSEETLRSPGVLELSRF